MKAQPALPPPAVSRPPVLLALAIAATLPALAEDPATPRRAGVTNSVDLARTPSASALTKPDPLVEIPATEVLVELAGRDLGPASGKANQEAAQGRLRASERPVTVEEAGGAIRFVRRQPGWRSVVQLVNPFAPLPRPEEPAALAFETRRRLDTRLPRPQPEGVQHESSLSVR